MFIVIENTSNPFLSIYSAILVAFVAGAFSLLGLTVSKENKISEFRQEWIDGLRSDIAELVAQAQVIYIETLEYFRSYSTDYQRYLDRTQAARLDLNRAGGRIKLRLNPREKESQELMRSIMDLQNLLEGNPQVLGAIRTEFRDSSKEVEIRTSGILSTEWKRVKRGEPGYRLARRIAVFALVVSIVVCAILFFRTNHVKFSRARPWVSIEQWQ
jgi:hypothetical protein